jgi:hypothetical protein
VAEGLDRVDGVLTRIAGRADVPGELAAELARLTLYADAQERKVAELQTTVLQLQTALESRIAIERAVGVLSERFDLESQDAFELLRGAARSSRRELRPLAEEIVASRGSSPAEIVAARRRRDAS